MHFSNCATGARSEKGTIVFELTANHELLTTTEVQALDVLLFWFVFLSVGLCLAAFVTFVGARFIWLYEHM